MGVAEASSLSWFQALSSNEVGEIDDIAVEEDCEDMKVIVQMEKENGNKLGKELAVEPGVMSKVMKNVKNKKGKGCKKPIVGTTRPILFFNNE